jgi:hypothetical protein
MVSWSPTSRRSRYRRSTEAFRVTADSEMSLFQRHAKDEMNDHKPTPETFSLHEEICKSFRGALAVSSFPLPDIELNLSSRNENKFWSSSRTSHAGSRRWNCNALSLSRDPRICRQTEGRKGELDLRETLVRIVSSNIRSGRSGSGSPKSAAGVLCPR